MEDINKCCQYLESVNCGDSSDHKHVLCSYSMTLLTNDVVKEYCLDKYESCILREEEDDNA